MAKIIEGKMDKDTISFFQDLYSIEKSNNPNGLKQVELEKRIRKHNELAFSQHYGKIRNCHTVKPYELCESEISAMYYGMFYQFYDMTENDEKDCKKMMKDFLAEDFLYYLLNAKDLTEEHLAMLGEDFNFRFSRTVLIDSFKYNTTFTEEGNEILKSFTKESLTEYTGRFPKLNEYFEHLYFLDRATLMPRSLSVMEVFGFWGLYECIVNFDLWNKYKKVYRVTKELTEDFLKMEEVRFPKSALQYLPFRVFYLDLTDSPLAKFEWKIDGILVRIVETMGKWNISCRVFYTNSDNRSRETDCLYSVANEEITIIDDEYVCNKETLKFTYNKETIQKPIGECKLMRDIEKFVLSTVFYLCCANKKTRKNVEYVSDDTIKSSKPTVRMEIDEETLGFTMNDLIIKGNMEDVDFDDDEKEVRVLGVGKGGRKLPKAHLVCGHFHHYWTGKRDGQRTLICRYIEPYFRGTIKNDTVHITTIKQ